MSFAHKVVLWVMQRRGYLVRLNKRQNFFHTLLFCSKGRTIRKVKGGGGEGNFRAAGIFFRYQIPCMNFF